MRSRGTWGLATAVAAAFTNEESLRTWLADPELDMLESLPLASKHPPPERGDHSSDGTGMKFESAWNDSRASVGDMSDGDVGAEEETWDSEGFDESAARIEVGGEGIVGVFIAGAGTGGRDVRGREDLETASAVNGSPHDVKLDTHTRKRGAGRKPTGSGRGHDGDGSTLR